jgi:hypothetical protein
MFSHHAEADEFFAKQRTPWLLQGLIALLVSGLASAVLTLIAA